LTSTDIGAVARSIAAYFAGGDISTAYVESVAIGDTLSSLAIFLSETRYIPGRLEETYRRSGRPSGTATRS
jgi:hypothetical protein